jgi:hypothetical protein
MKNNGNAKANAKWLPNVPPWLPVPTSCDHASSRISYIKTKYRQSKAQDRGKIIYSYQKCLFGIMTEFLFDLKAAFLFLLRDDEVFRREVAAALKDLYP